MTGNLQADGVQSRQTLFVRYCLISMQSVSLMLLPSSLHSMHCSRSDGLHGAGTALLLRPPQESQTAVNIFAFLSGSTATLCITASLATLRLIGEASFCVEFLFASSENEFIAAVLAYQSLIFVHSITLPFSRVSAWDSSCRNGLSGCSMKNVPAAGYRPENPGAITAKRLPNEVFVGHAAVHYPLILQRFRAVPQPVHRTLLRRSACKPDIPAGISGSPLHRTSPPPVTGSVPQNPAAGRCPVPEKAEACPMPPQVTVNCGSAATQIQCCL